MNVLSGDFLSSLPIKRLVERKEKYKNKRKLETFPLSEEVLNGKKSIKVTLIK